MFIEAFMIPLWHPVHMDSTVHPLYILHLAPLYNFFLTIYMVRSNIGNKVIGNGVWKRKCCTELPLCHYSCSNNYAFHQLGRLLWLYSHWNQCKQQPGCYKNKGSYQKTALILRFVCHLDEINWRSIKQSVLTKKLINKPFPDFLHSVRIRLD